MKDLLKVLWKILNQKILSTTEFFMLSFLSGITNGITTDLSNILNINSYLLFTIGLVLICLFVMLIKIIFMLIIGGKK